MNYINIPCWCFAPCISIYKDNLRKTIKNSTEREREGERERERERENDRDRETYRDRKKIGIQTEREKR